MAMGTTSVSFQGKRILINGEVTYQGCPEAEGLLFNVRTVHATFDDTLGQTDYWDDDGTHPENGYAGFGKWISPESAEANTARFIEKLPEYKSHGVLAINLNFQGGHALKAKKWIKEGQGSANKGVNAQRDFLHNSGFLPDGTIDPAYGKRLSNVIEASDKLGMVVILQLLYFGQDTVFRGEADICRAVDQAVDFIFTRKYSNVLLEIANEVSLDHYHHAILKPNRIAELIRRAKRRARDEYQAQLLVSTSEAGSWIWTEELFDAVYEDSDFILFHGGDGVGNIGNPDVVERKIKLAQNRPWYVERPRPIIFNEIYGEEAFEKALKSGVSYGLHNSAYFQTVWPSKWGVWENEAKWFFDKVKQLTT
jgi:hypothetical protein